MKTLYLDIFSGISGDMFLGALLDLGVDLKALEKELRKLPVEGYHLHVSKAFRSNIAGTKFDVHLEDHGHDPHHTHDHDHEHGHDHSHEHEHEHRDEQGKVYRHSHAHDHGAGHSHGHQEA